MNQNHALSACPAPTTRLEVLTTCSSGPARRCPDNWLLFFFISCQLSFVFHDKDQSCKFAKNTVRTNRFSNLMFRLWSKLLCRWLASATHTWASNFPGCKRWWVIINDLWWWIMNVMTLMNIMMNMMTIILLPVHEPVTFQDLYWWMMNIMMTNDNGADPKN